MKRALLVAATCGLLAFSCKVKQVSEQPFYKSIFEKNTKEFTDFEYVENDDKTLILCIRKSSDDFRLFSYQVYDLQTEGLIYENSFIGSGIVWNDVAEVAISGTSRIEPNELRIINVITKKSSISKPQEKNK